MVTWVVADCFGHRILCDQKVAHSNINVCVDICCGKSLICSWYELRPTHLELQIIRCVSKFFGEKVIIFMWHSQLRWPKLWNTMHSLLSQVAKDNSMGHSNVFTGSFCVPRAGMAVSLVSFFLAKAGGVAFLRSPNFLPAVLVGK